MKATWEEMDQYNLKPGQRDYCAHLLMPLMKCQVRIFEEFYKIREQFEHLAAVLRLYHVNYLLGSKMCFKRLVTVPPILPLANFFSDGECWNFLLFIPRVKHNSSWLDNLLLLRRIFFHDQRILRGATDKL